MNFKTTLYLFVLLMMVGFIVFMQYRIEEQTPEEVASSTYAEGAPLFANNPLRQEDITSITIEEAGKTLAFEKKDGQWMQTQPVRFPMNAWSMDQLATQLASVHYVQKYAAGASDSPTEESASLRPADAVVTVELNAGDGQPMRTHLFRLGAALPVGGMAYLQVDDTPDIYVVPNGLHQRVIDAKINDWRQSSMNAPKEGRAQRILLRLPERTIELVKRGVDWSFTGDASGRVDTAAVTKLLGDLGRVLADEFVAANPASMSTFGLDMPYMLIEVEATNPAAASSSSETTGDSAAAATIHKTFRVGAPRDLTGAKRYASWSEGEQAGDVVFAFAETLLKPLMVEPDVLRDPAVTPMQAPNIRSLKLQRSADDTINLGLTPRGWVFEDPDPGFMPDHDAITQLIAGVVAAKARGFVNAPAPDIEPAATITMTASGRAEPDVLRLFPTDQTVYAEAADRDAASTANSTAESNKATPKPLPAWLVYRNFETTGYLAPKQSLSQAFASVITLRSKLVADPPSHRVNRIELEHAGGRSYTFLRDVPETTSDDTIPAPPSPWRLEGASAFESAAFSSLIGQVMPLIAVDWIDNQPDLTPTHTLTISTVEGQRYVLQVNADTAMATMSTMAQDAMADIAGRFQIAAPTLKLLDQEFRQRTMVDITLEQIQQVTRRMAGDELTLMRIEDGAIVAGDDRPLKPASPRALLDALAPLQAQTLLDEAPDSVDEDSPLATFTITNKEVLQQRFSLYRDGERFIAQTKSQWFVIDARTAGKLIADLNAQAGDAAYVTPPASTAEEAPAVPEDAETDGGQVDDEVETKGSDNAVVESEAESKLETQAKAQPQTQAETEGNVEVDTDTDTDTDTDADADAGDNTESKTEREAAVEVEQVEASVESPAVDAVDETGDDTGNKPDDDTTQSDQEQATEAASDPIDPQVSAD